MGFTAVCLLVAGQGAFFAAAAPIWGRPFRLAAAVSQDVVPAQIAFSPSGATAVGYSLQDMDNPANSAALVLQGRSGSHFGASRSASGQQQVLALGYAQSGLELLVGTSDAARACCSWVQAIGPAHGGSLGRARTLFPALAGATLARLVVLPNRLLAVAGTDRGVWVSQSATGGERFAPPHRLSAANQLPQSLDAIALPQGQSVVAWTARKDQMTAAGPRSIYVSSGSARQAPQRPHAAITVAADHAVDEIALARGAKLPTLAWIESWHDRNGNFHSQANVADLSARPHPQAVSSDGELAAGVTIAGDDRGDQALAWKACGDSGSCATRAVLRRAQDRFGPVQHPGAIDAAESPVAALTPGRSALIGWIHSGHVFAGSSRTTRMSGGTVVSRTTFAADLTLAAAPNGGALAVWTQGTLAQSLMGADFGGR